MEGVPVAIFSKIQLVTQSAGSTEMLSVQEFGRVGGFLSL
jgi:hypothetical protein